MALPPLVRALAPLGLCCALLWPAAARAEWRVDHRALVSVEGAVDTNPRRAPGEDAGAADVLVYLFGSGRLALAGPADRLRVDAEVGGKAFSRVGEEDVAAWRLKGAWRRRLGRAGLGLDLDYKDKRQRGLPLDTAGEGGAPACTPPDGVSWNDYRCARRDYRSGRVAAVGALAPGPSLSLRAALGAEAFEYKPSPEFSWWGPRADATLAWRLSDEHQLLGGLDLARRLYPDGTTFRSSTPLPGEPVTVVATGEPRQEWRVGGVLGWTWRGPVLLEATALLSRTVNGGVGLDAWRGRLELHAAGRLGPATTLVLSAAVQLAHWPGGNALRRLQLAGDESEQQNAVAAKLSQALTRHLSVVVKGQLYSNEFATRAEDALPFRRGVFQTGLEVEL